MEIEKKINEYRKGAQATQCANKIIEAIDKMYQENNALTKERWIWELIQNAKDIANLSGKVDISIELDEYDQTLTFSHNGKLFDTKSIIYLIEQVSTKERNELARKEDDITGKFGTGFLTTHLLSKFVNVSGLLQVDTQIYKFNVDIDRSSNIQKDLIESINNSCKQLVENSIIFKNNVYESKNNTVFTYKLDSEGVNIARRGIEALNVSAPYVFTFCPKINSIQVNIKNADSSKSNLKIERVGSEHISNKIEKVELNFKTDRESSNRSIISFNSGFNISIALEVEEKNVVRFNNKLAKIFCDFPLLGTHDFCFPVVVNSASFNPTEPRDGISLVDMGDERKDVKSVAQNKNLMKEAVSLYEYAISYLVENEYKNLYNAVEIKNAIESKVLNADWFYNNITESLREAVYDMDIIKTHCGKMCSIRECLIPRYDDIKTRKSLWDLLKYIEPDNIPTFLELNQWCDSLWEECCNIDITYITYFIVGCRNIDILNERLVIDVIDWLSKYYELKFSENNEIKNSCNIDVEDIPNGKGEFCCVENLEVCGRIDNVYIELAEMANLDLESGFLHKDFVTLLRGKVKFDFYTFEDLEKELLNNINNISMEASFYNLVFRIENSEHEEQRKLIDILKQMDAQDWTYIKTNKSSESLYDNALWYYINLIIGEIEEANNLLSFKDKYNFSKNNAIDILNKFLTVLSNSQYEIYINKSNIVLNQLEEFVCGDSIYQDEIDDEIKNVYKCVSHDIRGILKHKKIKIKFPNTKRTSEYADRIINFILEHKHNLTSDEDAGYIFMTFKDYLEKLEPSQEEYKLFKKLIDNLIWFYNDKQIVKHEKGYRELQDILRKTGAKSVDQLHVIFEHITGNENMYQNRNDLTSEILIAHGITNDDELQRAMKNHEFNSRYRYESAKTAEMFEYVNRIMQRAKKNVLSHLINTLGYEIDTKDVPLDKTIFLAKKDNEEIYVIARPSDGNKVVIYYDSERDFLEDKDCELWVEDGNSDPKKLTFGKILKLTKINVIPLREI